MSSREITECDGCGKEVPLTDGWWVANKWLDNSPDDYDFCSRACLLKRLGGDGFWYSLEHAIPVKVGSFAWAMQRVKDGAKVRRRDQPTMPHMERHEWKTLAILPGDFDAEWEEVS